MKLGIVFGRENVLMEPGYGWRLGYNQHPNTFAMYPKFYPDEIFACLSPYNIDLDICKQLDAVIYYSGLPDRYFINVIDSIPCKVIVMLTCGYSPLLRSTMDDLVLLKQIMDKADFILGYDEYFEGVVSLFTDTPIITIKLPMPMGMAVDGTGGRYDIIVPYGPYECESTGRNGYVAALAGQKIIDTVDGYRSMAIFNMTKDSDVMVKSDATLKLLGCRDYKLFPLIPYAEFLSILLHTKLVINLDVNTGAGKIAIDCGLMRKHGVFSNMLAYARDIYRDTPSALVFPYDVSSVVDAASAVWFESDYENAYSRAMKYNIADAAHILEQEVLGA